MATNPKKSVKSAVSSDRRSKRSEETPSVDPLKDESLLELARQSSEQLVALEQYKEEGAETEVQILKEPSPEPEYEEAVLTKIIVESYEGEEEKGFYHGEGEAFLTGGHHYKGQFADGMMHGNGIFTWNSNLVYEGQFQQNRVQGKGNYVWPDGSTYEGDVVNGLRHGFGTFVSANGKSSYTGEWHGGKRNGKGRMNYTADESSFYDGDWVNNIRHGFGTRQHPSQNVYEGMWFNNMRHGEGTMRWLDRNQMYSGQWQNGTQHGFGQHIWFLQRIGSSQYPLRNTYEGEFDHGLRCGFGTFYYANGARYEGEWKDNMKHGKGKFIFKNGRVYEGIFEKDHIVEYPSFTMDTVNTPDLTQIRTRTPLASEMSIASNESRNTYGPSFQLEVESLLQEFPDVDREEEAAQVIFVIMRYMSNLRKIYTFYSRLGFEDSPDNTFVMSRMQFWRFLKDCRLHRAGVTLTEMDRVLAGPYGQKEEMHNPHVKILFREFINHLVMLAWHIYHEEHEGTSPILAWCMSKLIADNILQHACNVNGYIYIEPRRATNAMVHMDQSYEVYKSWSTPRKYAPGEPVLKMRQFLYLMKDFKLVNVDLTPKEIIDVLAVDDPNVTDPDGAINLELEMTFLEFFEALVGCAQVYVTESVVKDPTTPRPSTTMTQGGQTILSVTGSASQASGDGEEEEEEMPGSSAPGASEVGSPVPRAASNATQRTNEVSNAKNLETQQSAMTVGSVASENVSSRQASANKKSDMMLSEQKKSASFVSSHSAATEGEAIMVQSYVSIAAQSEAVEEQTLGDLEVEEEELDEATRQFNFWTHQVHIFFVRKFFPAAQRMLILKKLVQERENAEKTRSHVAAPDSRSCSRQSDTANKVEGGGDTGELADIAEQPEPEAVSVH